MKRASGSVRLRGPGGLGWEPHKPLCGAVSDQSLRTILLFLGAQQASKKFNFLVFPFFILNGDVLPNSSRRCLTVANISTGSTAVRSPSVACPVPNRYLQRATFRFQANPARGSERQPAAEPAGRSLLPRLAVRTPRSRALHCKTRNHKRVCRRVNRPR